LVARQDNGKVLEFLQSIEDPPTRAQADAERELVNVLEGGCKVPIGALASSNRDSLYVTGCILSNDGKTRLESKKSGNIKEAAGLGREVAEELISNGANLLFDIIKSHGNLLPSVLGDLQLLAVGPKTKEALARQGMHGVHLPDKFSSLGIADFLSTKDLGGKRILLARSSSADNSLGRELAKNGATVATVNLYDSVIPSDATGIQRFVDLSEPLFVARGLA